MWETTVFWIDLNGFIADEVKTYVSSPIKTLDFVTNEPRKALAYL